VSITNIEYLTGFQPVPTLAKTLLRNTLW